jgi:hypothetical protein
MAKMTKFEELTDLSDYIRKVFEIEDVDLKKYNEFSGDCFILFVSGLVMIARLSKGGHFEVVYGHKANAIDLDRIANEREVLKVMINDTQGDRHHSMTKL